MFGSGGCGVSIVSDIDRWHYRAKDTNVESLILAQYPLQLQVLEVVSVLAKLDLLVDRELLAVPLVDHPFTGLTKSANITSHREVANAIEHRKRDRGP